MSYTEIKKNKKADLLPEETLKIILAVIGIGMLVLLAVLLYGIFSKRQDVVQAETNMNYIMGIIDRRGDELKSVDTGERTDAYVLLNPRNWALVGWENTQSVARPEICQEKRWGRCLCICPQKAFWKYQESFMEGCNTFRICREIKQDLLLVNLNEKEKCDYFFDGKCNSPIIIKQLLDNKKNIEIKVEKGTQNSKSFIGVEINIKD